MSELWLALHSAGDAYPSLRGYGDDFKRHGRYIGGLFILPDKKPGFGFGWSANRRSDGSSDWRVFLSGKGDPGGDKHLAWNRPDWINFLNGGTRVPVHPIWMKDMTERYTTPAPVTEKDRFDEIFRMFKEATRDKHAQFEAALAAEIEKLKQERPFEGVIKAVA